jgi:cbb3-type cytochrome oxidase subunit 3
MEEWAAAYKFAREALLGLAFVGIAIWLYSDSRKERLEAPARRMLEDDDLPEDMR